MLTWIEITGYRGFRQYRMDGLTRVNLLVGKNNSGKTALLEAVHLLVSAGAPQVLADIAKRRGEIITTDFTRGEAEFTDISHFFPGHELALNHSILVHGSDSEIRMTPVAVDETEEQKAVGYDHQHRSGYVLKIDCHPDSVTSSVAFHLSSDGGVLLDPFLFHRPLKKQNIFRAERLFLTPESLGATDMAALWDGVLLNGTESDVVAALSILEDRMQSVNFLSGLLSSRSGETIRNGGIVIGLKGQGRVPIGSFGDGMRRMLALALSLTYVKHGHLFVDEIDTGLHYSVLADMWKMIAARAAAAGAQVFATTHSWDCIAGLAEMCEENPDLAGEVSVHKITGAVARSIPFAGPSLKHLSRTVIDPRS